MSEQSDDPYEEVQRRAFAATTANNTLAQYAIGLLVTVVVLAVAALVGGEFLGAIPDDSPFSEQINSIEENTGTAFTLFAIAIIVVPAVAVILLIVRGFGGMMGGGTGLGGGR